MSISRRKLLAAGAAAPLLSSCATDLSLFSDEPLPALAARLGVCAATYATLEAGRPNTPMAVSGCKSDQPVHAQSIFQAASLTKPVIAYVALKLVRDGGLDLRAPVSRYLPKGYAHRQTPFGAAQANRVDLVPASTLARIPVATLLNQSSGLPNWASGALAPEFEPGQRWQYSGEGYVLLQAVISAVTGQDMRGQVVGGTSWLGWGTRHDFLEPNAAASLYTTAGDYVKLLAALLADAALLKLTLADPVPTEPALG